MSHRVAFPCVAIAALLSLIACSSDEKDQGIRATGGEQKMATKWFEALEANWPSEGGECDP